MEAIKTIVNELDIPYKRAKLRVNRELIHEIKYSMSQLCLNRMVALYAYNLGIIEYDPDEMAVKNARLANVILLKKEIDVQAYESLRQDLIKLEQCSDYYRTIQVDLRKNLLDLQLPVIYVYQGLMGMDKMKLCRHIISAGTYLTYKEPVEVGTLVTPVKEMESNRKLNHFYAATSFDLEGKNIGHVLVKK